MGPIVGFFDCPVTFEAVVEFEANVTMPSIPNNFLQKHPSISRFKNRQDEDR